MDKISVLVIDDEKPVRTAIKAALSAEGMNVATAGDTNEALSALKNGKFDVLLLDILMPGTDGFSFLKEIREQKLFVPVIVLSGLDEDSTMVKGYGLGADDYVTKPFNIAVLASKIRALCRRSREYKPDTSMRSEIRSGDFVLRLDIQKAMYKGKEISLSSKEFSILCKLMEKPGETISKEKLYKEIWGDSDFDRTKMLVYIKRIRDKIEDDPSNPGHLLTEWGKGYYFEP